MPSKSKYTAFVFALCLIAIAGFAVAFPLWLNSPSRTNINDPMSPGYKKPVVGTPTYTFTFTNTNTYTNTATPTYTTTPGPGPLLADFETSPTSADDNWVEPIVVNADTTDGSTVSPAVWAAGAQTTANGPSDAGSYCGCISGTLVQQQGSVYPYAYMALDVTPNGNVGATGDDTGYSLAQWNTWDPTDGIQFDYKATAGTPNTSYVVQMITDDVADGQFYQYQFTPTDNNWHTLDVYFPGVNTIGALFSQPNYGGGTQAFDITATGAVQFKVVASTLAGESYGLCVDNVGFNPPAAPTPTAAVFNGEQTPSDATDLWGQSIVVANSTSSTIYPSPNFAGFTGTDPNFPASTYYARVSGTVAEQTGSGADPYPYAYLAFNLAGNGVEGSPNGSFANCLPYATNDGFQFDYKAGAACTEYEVELISDQITNTAYWTYTWTSQDTNWHTVDVYFPASSTWYTPQGGWTPPAGVNVLTEPNYGAGGAAFDPENVGAFLFKAVASTTAPVDYDLSVDNLTFAAPPAGAGAPALDVSGGALTGGATMITDFEYAGSAENNFCDGGAGAFGPGPVSTNYDTTNNPQVTTMAANEYVWGPTSAITGNGPTLSGSSCVEISGTLGSSNNGCYANVMCEFAAGSYPESTVYYSGNVESLAPHKRLVFDYKSGVNGENEPILVQMMQGNAVNYAYYTYTFTSASDTNWHTVIIYFPDASYSPQFVIPYSGCIPWDPTQAQGVEIGPISQPAVTQYDLYLDNLFLD